MILSTILAILVSSAEDSTPSSAPRLPEDGNAPKREAIRSSYERYGAWQIGLAVGTLTDGGMSLRYWLDEKNGFELHGFAMLSKNEYPNDEGSMYSENTGADGYYYGGDTGTVEKREIELDVKYLHQILNLHLFDANGLIKGPSHLRCLSFVGAGGHSKYEKRSLTGISRTYYTQEEMQRFKNYHSTTSTLIGQGGVGAEWELSRFSVHLLFGYGGEYSLTASSYTFGSIAETGINMRF